MGSDGLGTYPCWEFLECEGEAPASRSGHTCSLHKNRYLYVFGGFDGTTCFDDLFVLDLDKGQWRKIEAGGDRPSGRASHSAVTDELAGVMYIFGGSGSHFGYTNKRDLCEFSFETETWRLLSDPLEDTPSARYGQSMVAHREGLYVWGGTHGTNYPTDMHRFDLCSKAWEYVVTGGDCPCGRYRHQAMVKDDLMYIVGGSGVNRYGDIFTFHFGACKWQKLICTGTDLSDGRYAHSAVLREGYIYLYGGNDGVRHDDLQQLDLETRVWSRVVVNGECPPGRDFHAAVLRRDSMVIFGGSNGMRRHNDVFEFQLTAKIPPCTLSTDLEVLLEQAQVDESVQLSCDVFLGADSGNTAQGIFCHSHLLQVRCPRLYQLVEESRRAPRSPLLESRSPMARGGAGAEEAAMSKGQAGDKEGAREDDTIDSLLLDVVADGASEVGFEGRKASRNRAGSRRTWVPVEMPPAILLHFVRYLYTNVIKYGRISAEQLYALFLVAKDFDMHHLAALCERQIKMRLGLDNVLPLLRASALDGPTAQPVQDACKHFFLANYNLCTDLRECEALDPKLLCELMRLHNFRVSSFNAASGGAASVPHAANAGTWQPVSATAPMSPMRGESRSHGLEEASRGCLPLLLDPLQRQQVSGVPMPPETLAQDLRRLLVEEIGPDFEVVVQDEVICAHRFMLVARSRYFASCILTSGMAEAQTGRLVIPANSAMTADALQAFLHFLYADGDMLHMLAPQTAMHLVDACSFYGLSNMRLKHFCELCVRDSFNEAHVLQLFEASSRLNVDAVRAMALEFIISHFRAVCRQPALEQLDRPLLVEILKGLAERIPQTAGASSAESWPRGAGA
mmetsp:Transcript_65944/g.146034  ORF Transcript_65944/g.146034 Transcript_65944/m.146034 type:complete len:849 (+) Transcript_65944:137-2683(+)